MSAMLLKILASRNLRRAFHLYVKSSFFQRNVYLRDSKKLPRLLVGSRKSMVRRKGAQPNWGFGICSTRARSYTRGRQTSLSVASMRTQMTSSEA